MEGKDIYILLALALLRCDALSRLASDTLLG